MLKSLKPDLPLCFLSFLDKHRVPLCKCERVTGEPQFLTGISLPELDHAVHIFGVPVQGELEGGENSFSLPGPLLGRVGQTVIPVNSDCG